VQARIFNGFIQWARSDTGWAGKHRRNVPRFLGSSEERTGLPTGTHGPCSHSSIIVLILHGAVSRVACES